MRNLQKKVREKSTCHGDFKLPPVFRPRKREFEARKYAIQEAPRFPAQESRLSAAEDRPPTINGRRRVSGSVGLPGLSVLPGRGPGNDCGAVNCNIPDPSLLCQEEESQIEDVGQPPKSRGYSKKPRRCGEERRNRRRGVHQRISKVAACVAVFGALMV